MLFDDQFSQRPSHGPSRARAAVRARWGFTGAVGHMARGDDRLRHRGGGGRDRYLSIRAALAARQGLALAEDLPVPSSGIRSRRADAAPGRRSLGEDRESLPHRDRVAAALSRPLALCALAQGVTAGDAAMRMRAGAMACDDVDVRPTRALVGDVPGRGAGGGAPLVFCFQQLAVAFRFVVGDWAAGGGVCTVARGAGGDVPAGTVDRRTVCIGSAGHDGRAGSGPGADRKASMARIARGPGRRRGGQPSVSCGSRHQFAARRHRLGGLPALALERSARGLLVAVRAWGCGRAIALAGW